MAPQQRIIAAVVSLTIFVLVIDLVRRKKLGEEFSWLWLLAGAALVVAATTDKLYDVVAKVTGIVTPTSIAFFFGIVFLILVCLQLSMKLSENRTHIRNLAQKMTLLEDEVRKVKAGVQGAKEE